MRLPVTKLVVPDGAGVVAVVSAAWYLCRGTDVTMPVRVVHQDGTPYDLSGAVAAILAFKLSTSETTAELQIEWTITDDAGGLAEFEITRDMWTLLPDTDYVCGVQFRDDDTEVEDATLLAGYVEIAPQIANFSQSVIVPESQEPLARGPKGDPGTDGIDGTINVVADFASLPAASTKPNLWYRTTDDGLIYFSDGTTWHNLLELFVDGFGIKFLSGNGSTIIINQGSPDDSSPSLKLAASQAVLGVGSSQLTMLDGFLILASALLEIGALAVRNRQ